jgi:hypothetical protein
MNPSFISLVSYLFSSSSSQHVPFSPLPPRRNGGLSHLHPRRRPSILYSTLATSPHAHLLSLLQSPPSNSQPSSLQRIFSHKFDIAAIARRFPSSSTTDSLLLRAKEALPSVTLYQARRYLPYRSMRCPFYSVHHDSQGRRPQSSPTS